MGQWIKIAGLGAASGIIAVLFIIGLVLVLLKQLEIVGYLAIIAAVIIGIIYAALGIVGILNRYR